jgi:hypothetical protein
MKRADATVAVAARQQARVDKAESGNTANAKTAASGAARSTTPTAILA